MANLAKFIQINSEEFDIMKLQDAILNYIRSLEAKIQELEDRLEAGGL